MAYLPHDDSKTISKPRTGRVHVPALVYSATGLPPGLSMDTSGRVTGTISAAAAGEYIVTVRVGDALGGDGNSASFIWTVQSADLDFSNIKSGSQVIWWVEVAHADVLGTPLTYLWGPGDLVHDADYYGGFKEGRVIDFGWITRGLSDEEGHYESSEFSFTVSDTDRLIRKTLDSKFAKHWQNRMVVARIIDEASRRDGILPFVMVRGVLRSYRPKGPLHFEFTGQDFAAQFMGLGEREKTVPYTTLSTDDFPNLPSVQSGAPVPILYGTLSDEAVRTATVSGLVVSSNLSYDVVGDPGTTSYLYTVTAIGLRLGPDPENPAQDHDHRQEFVWGQLLVENAPSPSEWSSTRFVRIKWNNVGAGQQAEWWGGDPTNGTPGGVGYRVYGRQLDQPGQLLYGTRTGGANNLWEDDNRSPRTNSNPPVTNNVVFDGDPNTPGATIQIDAGKGVVPTIYVGKRTMGSDEFHEFLICGHAIKSITAWYYGGVRQPVAPANELDPDLQTILVPGYAAYHDRLASVGGGTNTYMDRNGRRYTSLFIPATSGGTAASPGEAIAARAIDGTAPITVNVEGIESAGDGTGVLLSQLADIYKHFVVNFGFQDWAGGAWLNAPVWEQGLDFESQIKAKIDLESFDRMRTVHQRRISGGYPGGIMIGSPTESTVTLRDALRRLNVSCDCRCGFNRHSQFFVTIFDESLTTLDNALSYTQTHDILKGDFSMAMDVEKIENVVRVKYNRRYATTTVQTSTAGFQAADWLDDDTIDDDEAIDLQRERKPGSPIELWGVRSEDVARDIAFRRLLYYKQPPIPVDLTVTLKGLQSEIGDVIQVDHTEGGGENGWLGRPLWVQRSRIDPSKLLVNLEALDVFRLFSTAFVLGDDVVGSPTKLPDSWPDAVGSQKLRGYLCDVTTGTFSTGEEGKRLR